LPDYLDTSAFVKLVRSEPESSALRRELAGRELLSSALLTVEGRRAARRYGELAARRARAALTAITLVPLDEAILQAAAELEPAELRSLDALHLATVVSLGEDLERMYAADGSARSAWLPLPR
jgi:predicted nucleic acid-binding protein